MRLLQSARPALEDQALPLGMPARMQLELQHDRAEYVASTAGDRPELDISPRDPISLVQRFFSTLPSWWISAVFHTLFLLLLVILTQGATSRPPVMIVSAIAEQPDLPQDTPPVVIRQPDAPIDDLLTAADLAPAPLESGDPLVIQPPVIPIGNAFAKADLGHAGDMLTTGREGHKARASAGQPGAQFFGVQAEGNNFVFIVDSSMSMTQKFADAKRELEYAIRKLSPKQRFYVLFFDRNTERMTLGSWDKKHKFFTFNAAPEADLVPATTKNVDAFVHWMNTIQLELATNPFEATAFAISVLKPDARSC